MGIKSKKKSHKASSQGLAHNTNSSHLELVVHLTYIPVGCTFNHELG